MEYILNELTSRPGLTDVPAAELQAGLDRLAAAGLLNTRPE